MIECEITKVFDPKPNGQGFSFKTQSDMGELSKFFNPKYGTYITSIFTGGKPSPSWIVEGAKFKAEFDESDTGHLNLISKTLQIIEDASQKKEDDGTDFDAEEYEKSLNEAPLVNEDGNGIEILDDKEVKLREEVSKLLKFEAWKQDQIHNNLAKFEWFMNYPPEERQKFEIAEYIESNTQIHNRWRRG